jgi:hypothetical protein
MNALLGQVLDADGGLERWRRYNKVEATIAGSQSAAHDRVAARGEVLRHAVRSSRG